MVVIQSVNIVDLAAPASVCGFYPRRKLIMTNLKKSMSIAVGATFAVVMSASPVANAETNPFGMQSLDSGYLQVTEGKCGEGKCGENKGAKKMEGKCGEGKCGENKSAKKMEGKCGENKGAKKMEGKCGGTK
jgi:uncharacterized low-complexity protein